ncbi:hypothetical protein H312_03426 [Anncaliia algerae PRA339]|uniref:Uncharacterized protein n=1 Tax=Anncaliia algerae PRA339 TaxID=1288291 RepID=A0A059EWU6_9MICR|nr:hypothetical protein H312_03426 [Anncaliia algerae PRA339]
MHDKLGGIGKIVHGDKTMLNFKYKSIREDSPKNRTDALCTVEVNNGIGRAYPQITAKKKLSLPYRLFVGKLFLVILYVTMSTNHI